SRPGGSDGAARGPADRRREPGTERARAGEGVSPASRRHRPRHHEARRHGEGRHRARHREEAGRPRTLRGRRRGGRRPRPLRRGPGNLRADRGAGGLIRFENVHKRYPNGKDALRGVSFALERGEMAFLTGPSGAGKSTLLPLITLIEKPSRGTVLVNSQNTSRVSRRKIPAFRQRIGVVFQDHKLLYDRSVFDNVALPLVIGGLGPREIARRVRAALDQVGLLGRERHAPITLSTGEDRKSVV